MGFNPHFRPMKETAKVRIPGYDFDTKSVARSPATLKELRQLEEATGWTEEDARWLRIAAETLVPRAEEMVDAWRAVIGRTPQLVASFLKPGGKPDEAYKTAGLETWLT